MSSCPELPAPKTPIPQSKSDGHYPREETISISLHSSDLFNSESHHSSSNFSDDYTTTYSASAIGAESDLYATTSDTLGMIDTPWSAESWESRLTHVTTPRTSEIATETKTNVESALTLTTFTIDPKSSVSFGVKSPSLLTLSSDTWNWTRLNSASTVANRSLIAPSKVHNVDSLDTVSSWTVESFTSAGMVEDENKVRVRYPWSPRTFRSESTGVTAYPSTVSMGLQSTLPTIPTPSGMTSLTDFKRIIPVNYLVLDTMHRIFNNP